MSVKRILSKDVALWSDNLEVQKELASRLGWVDSIDFCIENQNRILKFAALVDSKGIDTIVLLAMGGSALAPEVFCDGLGDERTKKFHLLDTTHSEQIVKVDKQLNYQSTLFIVASKSGGTLETRILMDYFYSRATEELSSTTAGDHFVAITDEGSGLFEIAQERVFLDTFINPSDIGGRYSALSFFGLLPATLIGLPLEVSLKQTSKLIESYASIENPLGLKLAQFMLLDYKLGADKIAVTSNLKGRSFVLWIEQLVAESLGKDGQGVMPYLESDINAASRIDCKVKSLHIDIDSKYEGVGFEVLDTSAKMTIESVDQLGEAFYHWEIATAYVAAEIGVNPFDQPNVAEVKSNTQRVLKGESSLVSYSSYTDIKNDLVTDKTGYLSLFVYTPINDENWLALEKIQKTLSAQYQLPVAVSFGPRYLHSTGQLNKGGKRNGNFLIILDLPESDLAVPDSTMSFNGVMKAQAEGDYFALVDKGLTTHIVQVDGLASLF